MPSRFLVLRFRRKPGLRTLAVLFCALALVPLVATAQPADTLRLETVIERARAQNFGVQIAQEEAVLAERNYTLGNAGFLPRLSLQFQQNRRPDGRLFGGGDDLPGGGVSGGSELGSFDGAVNLNWTVFDGLRRFARYDQLEAQRDEAVLQAREAEEWLLAEVITRYYAVARQQEQIEVLEEAVELSEERLRIAELRRDLGSASDLDVRQASIDLNEDRAALLDQQSALAAARSQLRQLLGGTLASDFFVRESIDLEAQFDLEQLQADARQQNRQLRAARAAETAAGLEQRVVRSERLPRIDLTVGYTMNELASDVGVPTVQPGGLSYGLTASIDLFDGFDRRRRAENAEIRRRSQELAVAELETELSSVLESTLEEYENSRQRAELEEANLEAARLNVDVALERFRLGTITSIELREVQRTLTRIESRRLAALFEAKRAETVLLQLSGRLLPQW